MTAKYFFGYLGLILLLCAPIVIASDSFLDDFIGPYDQSLYIANGNFFATAFHEIPSLVSSPADWLWNYYHQYPALAVRRAPPLFSIVLGLHFCVFGATVASARMLLLALTVAFNLLIYAVSRKAGQSKLTSIGSVWLLSSYKFFFTTFTDLWLDLPTTCLTLLTTLLLFKLLNTQESESRREKYLILGVLACTIASLYCYQLAFPCLLGLLVTLTIQKKPWWFLRRRILILGTLFIVSLIPFVYQNIYLAPDQLSLVSGGSGAENYEIFASRIPSWLHHIRSLQHDFPIAGATLLLLPIIYQQRQPRFGEQTWLTVTISSLVFFALIPSVHTRYTFYIALPLTLLFSSALESAAVRLRNHWKLTNLAGKSLQTGLILSMALVNVKITGSSSDRSGVRGFDQVTSKILSLQNTENILYCGVWDAGFISTLALNDQQRKARVFKADIEIHNDQKFKEFISQNRISTIALETDNFPAHQTSRIQMRERIYDYVKTSPQHVISQTIYNLEYKTDKGIRTSSIRVYQIPHSLRLDTRVLSKN